MVEWSKEKLQGTEIQCHFGDSEICLNFRKLIGPLRNGRKPIFVTILLPEFISDQVVRLAFSNFQEVVSVFKGETNLTEKLEMVKGMLKSSPREEIQRYYQGKFLSMVGSKGMFFSQKRRCCATGTKLGTCLARIAL